LRHLAERFQGLKYPFPFILLIFGGYRLYNRPTGDTVKCRHHAPMKVSKLRKTGRIPHGSLVLAKFLVHKEQLTGAEWSRFGDHPFQIKARFATQWVQQWL
jgi:hypothetical protein